MVLAASLKYLFIQSINIIDYVQVRYIICSRFVVLRNLLFHYFQIKSFISMSVRKSEEIFYFSFSNHIVK